MARSESGRLRGWIELRSTKEADGGKRKLEKRRKRRQKAEGRRKKKKVTVKEHTRGKKKPALAASADVTTYR